MPAASWLGHSSSADVPFGSLVRCPGCGLINFCSGLVWFGFVLFLVSGFLFCVVQSGMEASSQCLFPEAGGVEGEGIEYPKGERPHSFPLFVLRG